MWTINCSEINISEKCRSFKSTVGAEGYVISVDLERIFSFLKEAAELHKTRHIPFLNKPEAINALDSILHASM